MRRMGAGMWNKVAATLTAVVAMAWIGTADVSADGNPGASAAGVAAVQQTSAPSVVADDDIHLLFAGDLMHHNAQERLGKTHPDGMVAGYFAMWAGVAGMIGGADVAVANLETPVAGGPNGGFPAFNAPVEYLRAADQAGFDVLTFANNHSLDRGLKGFGATIGNIGAAGMTAAGDGHTVELVVRGRKISIIAFTSSVNIGSRWRAPPGRVGPYVVRYRDETARAGLLDRIRTARAASDLVVVSVHWGIEYRDTPPAWYRAWAGEMADAGADVIVGHHPHVVGPVEWIPRADGGRTVVAYSLGNFSSGMIRDATPLGGVLDVRLAPDGEFTAGIRLVWTARDNIDPVPRDGKSVRIAWRTYRTVPAADLEADCAERTAGVTARSQPAMSRSGAARHECRRYRDAMKLFRKFQPGQFR